MKRILYILLTALVLASTGWAALNTDINILDAFDVIVDQGVNLQYKNFLGKEPQNAFFAHKSFSGYVSWKTEAIPAKKDTMLIFIGGNHNTGQFELSINGEYALTFRSGVKDRTVFVGANARILFDCLGKEEEIGYTGIYYLMLDKSLVTTGEPLTISVQSRSGANNGWFAIFSKPAPKDLINKSLDEILQLINDWSIKIPLSIQPQAGAVIPLSVNTIDTEYAGASVTCSLKTIFNESFTESVGKQILKKTEKGITVAFEYVNSEPGQTIFIFSFRVVSMGTLNAPSKGH